jgi:hypothetical protein
MTDAPEKVGFMDDHWVQVPGGGAIAEATDDSVYLAIALRNVGTGLAVLDRWELWVERLRRDEPGPIESFRRLTRDLYIAAGDGGFWQGTIRDPTDPLFASVGAAIRERQAMTVDLLYGDHDGGQRAITRFALLPAGDSKWIAAVSRHWSLDRDQPREAPSGR